MSDDENFPFNSANRLRKVALELRDGGQRIGGNPSRNQLIERVLELDGALPSHQRQRQVLSFINDANTEIDRVEHELQVLRVPPTIYKNTVAWLRSLFSAENLMSAMDQANLFPSAHFLFAGWVSFATGKDQDEMDGQVLVEIAEGIVKLIDEIKAAGFSPALTAFLVEKLNDALLAVRSYRLTGLAPLYWKFRNIASEVQVREKDIEKEAASDPTKAQAWEKFVKLWNGTHDQIQKVSNTITSVAAAAGSVTVLLTYTGIVP
jgi:hypothetical protein